jgi:hypothetical protein
MTAQKLLELLKFRDELDKKLRLQPNLETVKQSLDNLVGSPASPPYQAALASAQENLSNSAMALGELLTPSRAAARKEIGGTEFIDPDVTDRVKDSVQKNAMTPSVAKDFVERLVNARAAFLETVRNGRRNLETLNIQEAKPSEDLPDVAFLIPREPSQNHLGVWWR